MALSVSNLQMYTPSSTKPRINIPQVSRVSGLSSTKCRAQLNGTNHKSEALKDNLDHLPRAQRQQTQPKRRVAQSTPVGLWDKYPEARTIQQMMDTMNRLIVDPVGYGNTWISTPVKDSGYGKGRTPWAINEREKDFKIRFDMPGMTRGDVRLYVEESNMLVIKAEKVAKMNPDDAQVEPNEGENGEDWPAKSFGRYNYRIALPENVELEKITAEVRDGVLYITIPKTSTENKIIEINVH